MPAIRVMFWNIQNFGEEAGGYRARQSRIHFIARTIGQYGADIVCIQELKANAIANYYLQTLQQELNMLPAPFNNWYYDWIKGSLAAGGGHPANYPFNTAADLNWDAGHHEGYAVFWNQNIAKFTVQPAPPIQVPGGMAVANTQSEDCRMQGRVGFGAPPVWMPLPGLATPGGVVAPGAPPYIVPAGTTIPGHGVVGAATPTAAGTVLPVGTTVGPGGITTSVAVNNVNPVVVPAGYALTDALTLPAVGAVLVPQNALSLAMFGRDSSNPLDPNHTPTTFNGNTAAVTDNFLPGGGNIWNWTYFTQGVGGPATRTGARRPAYLTIKVNRPGFPAAADQLVPIIVYHAPSAAPASNSGMQRSAYIQPMYQAYDSVAGAWVNCNNALNGGDYNVINGDVAYPYQAFTGGFGGGGVGGGANCTMAVANPAPHGGIMGNNPLNKSIIALTNGVAGPWRYSANRVDFRSMAIDNIFYRGLGTGMVGGGVVGAGTLLLDMLTASSVGGVLTGAAIQNCLNTPNMVNVQTAVYVHHAAAPQPNMVDSTTTLHDMNAGAFGTQPDYTAQNTGARRAAEFYNLFISDHLPAAIQFNM
jgi:hypothetical protein